MLENENNGLYGETSENSTNTSGTYDQNPAPQNSGYYRADNTGSSEYHYTGPDAGKTFESAAQNYTAPGTDSSVYNYVNPDTGRTADTASQTYSAGSTASSEYHYVNPDAGKAADTSSQTYTSGSTSSSEYHYANPDAGRSFDTAAKVNSAYSNYTYNNPYVAADTPVYSHDFTPEKTKPVKTRRKAGHGWLVALCIILSLASGFGGAWTYSKFFGKNQVVISTVSDSTPTGSEVTVGSDDLTDIIAKAKGSVVEITTEIVKTGSFFSQSIATGAGSGVIIDSDGYIVTNYHVIQGASTVTVTTPDGTEYPAKVYGYDSENDVAVVKIDAHDLPVAVFADSSKLKVGEKVFAIGNPLGSLGGTVTDGIVSALDRDITVEGQRMTLLQTSAAVNHGNSGGGLFNAKGELIGIVNAKSSGEDVEGLGFAIPSNVVKDVITNILNNGGSIVSSTPVMGITVAEIYDENTLKEYNLSRYGVYILNVEEGYGAAQAGLKVYDCIVSVDNIAISKNDDLTSLLKTHEAGDVITVQVIRGNRLMTFEVTLKLRDQA